MVLKVEFETYKGEFEAVNFEAVWPYNCTWIYPSHVTCWGPSVTCQLTWLSSLENLAGGQIICKEVLGLTF